MNARGRFYVSCVFLGTAVPTALIVQTPFMALLVVLGVVTALVAFYDLGRL